MVIKCDPRAYAKCPTRHLCGTYCDDVCFEEGSDCDKFNQTVINAPPTNADRLRTMSDEELAEFMAPKPPHDGFPWCEPIGRVTCGKCSCNECCLKWLKQPAE